MIILKEMQLQDNELVVQVAKFDREKTCTVKGYDAARVYPIRGGILSSHARSGRNANHKADRSKSNTKHCDCSDQTCQTG